MNVRTQVIQVRLGPSIMLPINIQVHVSDLKFMVPAKPELIMLLTLPRNIF